jgi:superfamily II DNA or RNA helicase
MNIDVDKSNIIIKDASLKSSQVSQLKYWGFKSSGDNLYIYSEGDFEKRLLQISAYFKKEGLNFKASRNFESNITSITNRTEEFKRTKKIGEDFKNGKYDKSQYKEFLEFLKEHLSTRKLKPHQRKAAFHLYLIHNGANFSVPGSGKTTVALTVYEKLRSEGKANVLFVVGPPACFGPWKTEFVETLGRKPKHTVLAGGNKSSRKNQYFANSENKLELYLTTYQTLINDQKEINSFFSQKGIKVFLVIDEAHYIKQLNGNWASAVLNIAKYAKFRCILTGTPIPKTFSDLYNLFDFLWPENETIDSSSRIKLQAFEKAHKIDQAKEILNDRVGPLFYRVKKNDLGLKPAKFHEPIVLRMNKYEKIVYDAIERQIRNYSMRDYLQNVDLINKLKRGRMIRLRQSVSYLSLLKNVIENYEEDILENEKDLRYIIRDYDILEMPGKLQYLSQKVRELLDENRKVVIWANFIGTIEKIETHFKSLKFYSRSIYGKTPIEQSSVSEELTREQIRDEFVDSNSGLNILIANPAACAESISLHKTCHNAIYYDLSYNCAQYLQSLDRIHRVGGSEKIQANYFFLQYENTIDQDILFNLRRKAEKMSRIIDQDYRIYSLDMLDEDDDDLTAYNRLFAKE